MKSVASLLENVVVSTVAVVVAVMISTSPSVVCPLFPAMPVVYVATSEAV
jgi:hypothetical protein